MIISNGGGEFERIDRAVVTIGAFDGVHYGHRAIIDMLTSHAKSIGGSSVLVTFYPHPRKVIVSSDLCLLNSQKEKEYLLQSTGLDCLYLLNFTKELSMLSGQEFIDHFLLDRFNLSTLVVGYNHHFGHDRKCDFDFLRQLSPQYGFDVLQIPKHDVENHKVSSTIIRDSIASGDILTANKYLAHPYFFIADVDSFGRLIIDEPSKLIPTSGAYEVELSTIDGCYLGTDTALIRDREVELQNTIDKRNIVVDLIGKK